MILEKYDNIVKKENFEGYLLPKYNTRKSFYNKAEVYKKYDEIQKANMLYLRSYDTIVAVINLDTNKPCVFGYYSQTTARHINEFLLQNGFNKMSKKEMEA